MRGGTIGKISAPVPQLWDESVLRFVVPPKFKARRKASFDLLWYGEGAVGVSAPAPPLSFVQSGRGALSAASLSVGRCLEYCCGICAARDILCGFP